MSVFTFAFGLAMAKAGVFFFLGGYGCCWRYSGISAPCLAGAAAAGALCGIFCALTYAISRDVAQTLAAAAVLALCVAAIPGLELAFAVCLVRGLFLYAACPCADAAMLITFRFPLLPG